jgi:microsomal dipeptidase-like Zn-dependent dipeptidase
MSRSDEPIRSASASANRRAHETAALPPDATMADLAASMDYAVRRIGVDHVGISSDFSHRVGVAGWRDEGEAFSVHVSSSDAATLKPTSRSSRAGTS